MNLTDSKIRGAKTFLTSPRPERRGVKAHRGHKMCQSNRLGSLSVLHPTMISNRPLVRHRRL